jgi:hypothetical protein
MSSAGSVKKVGEKGQSVRHGTAKTVSYIVILAVLLSGLNFLFSWTSLEEMPPYLQPYSSIILLIHPYLLYIQAALVFIFGYLAVNALSGLIYAYMRRATDHPTAATVRAITRISGIAVLLSVVASAFNVNPAAALTVGSFGGLVVGFATQTILSHVVAGVFLLVSRPFTYGDVVTVSGQTGVVRKITLMHLVLETEDGAKDVLIPSGTVVTQIIQKKKPPLALKPVATSLMLDSPPSSVKVGSKIIFAGRLVEADSGNSVAGAIVRILDSDVGGDDLVASGATKSDGRFGIEWTVKRTDLGDNTAEIFAEFEGDDDHRQSKSEQYTVVIKGKERSH